MSTQTDPDTPLCDTCGKPCEGFVSQVFDAEGHVLSNTCYDCQNQAVLAQIKLSEDFTITTEMTTCGPLIQCWTSYEDALAAAEKGHLSGVETLISTVQTLILYTALVKERGSRYRSQVSTEDAFKVWLLIDTLKAIGEQVTVLDKEMWLGQLQPIVRACDMKGMSATCGDTKYLTWSMCGRMMMTIQEPDGVHVTVMTAEDEDTPHMGLRGINATKDQALAILKTTVERWKAGLLTFKADDEVSYL